MRFLLPVLFTLSIAIIISLPSESLAQSPSPDVSLLAYAQRGPYPVGVIELTLPDGASGQDIPLTLWYPANTIHSDAEPITYTAPLLSVDGNAYQDVTPADLPQAAPVVVFSHGLAGTRYFFTDLLEHVASYGYVVIAMDHPTNTIFDAINRQQFIDDIPINFAWRVRDMSRVLAFIDQDLNVLLAGIADTHRIGLMGHSFGGYTVLVSANAIIDFAELDAWCTDNAGGPLDPFPDRAITPAGEQTLDDVVGLCFLQTYKDSIAQAFGYQGAPNGGLLVVEPNPNIQAIITFAPYAIPFFGQRGLASMDTPLLILAGDADPVTPYERDGLSVYAWAASSSKTLITFADGGHSLATDDCPDVVVAAGAEALCSDPVWDGDLSRAVSRHYAVAFLASTLHGDAEAFQLIPLDGLSYTTTISTQ